MSLRRGGEQLSIRCFKLRSGGSYLRLVWRLYATDQIQISIIESTDRGYPAARDTSLLKAHGSFRLRFYPRECAVRTHNARGLARRMPMKSNRDKMILQKRDFATYRFNRLRSIVKSTSISFFGLVCCQLEIFIWKFVQHAILKFLAISRDKYY